MRQFATAILIALSLATLGGCVVGPAPAPDVYVGADDPYVFSAVPCVGCWHGTWAGREGWHRGGGRPWERPHHEGDHLGGVHVGHGPVHEGHHS